MDIKVSSKQTDKDKNNGGGGSDGNSGGGNTFRAKGMTCRWEWRLQGRMPGYIYIYIERECVCVCVCVCVCASLGGEAANDNTHARVQLNWLFMTDAVTFKAKSMSFSSFCFVFKGHSIARCPIARQW